MENRYTRRMEASAIATSAHEKREQFKEMRVAQLYESFVSRLSENLCQMFFYEESALGEYDELRDEFKKHVLSPVARETLELFAFVSIRKFVDALDEMSSSYKKLYGDDPLNSKDIFRTGASVGHDVMHYFVAYLHSNNLNTMRPDFLGHDHDESRREGGAVWGTQAKVEEIETILFSASYKLKEWIGISARKIKNPNSDQRQLFRENFLREVCDYTQKFGHDIPIKSLQDRLAPSIGAYVDQLFDTREPVGAGPIDALDFFVSTLQPELANMRTVFNAAHE